MTLPPFDKNFFRHEYGRLVAVLSHRVGIEHIEDVEDAVQSALMIAFERWIAEQVPTNPSAWLFRVANNNLMDELRGRSRRLRILQKKAAEEQELDDGSERLHGDEVKDDLLHMLFVCCHESIPETSQVALALKTLCGFNVREISLRIFTSEANVYKRLDRARDRLREFHHQINELTTVQYATRLFAVQRVLYIMFTEGYLTSTSEQSIRLELCEEAIRLATILANDPIGKSPETYALLALMHLHAARTSARQDHSDGLLLLEEQDRSLWDQKRIQEGLTWLGKSAEGDFFSRYHAEAGIAAEHCLAPSFRETRWDRVVECYLSLEGIAESPIHTLNRAVAVAEWQGPAAGLKILEDIVPPTWLTGSYMWSAVLSDLNRRCGHLPNAKRYRETAVDLAPTDQIKELLERRLRTVDK